MPAAAAVGALAEIVATAGLAAGLAVGLGRAQADTTARPPRWRARSGGAGRREGEEAGRSVLHVQARLMGLRRIREAARPAVRLHAPAPRPMLVDRHPVDGLREP